MRVVFILAWLFFSLFANHQTSFASNAKGNKNIVLVASIEGKKHNAKSPCDCSKVVAKCRRIMAKAKAVIALCNIRCKRDLATKQVECDEQKKLDAIEQKKNFVPRSQP